MGSYVLFHEKMLANLTSLIWGTPSNEEAKDTTEKSASGDPIEQQTVPEASSQPLKCATPTIRAATPADEEESDWVLVERAEDGGVSHGDDQTTTQRLPVPSSVLASSPLPFAGEVGETATQEWLMTPPPCFTRSQTAPLASSPLENLLIEHPSMSVYLPRPTNTSAAIGRIFPRRVLSHPSPYSRSSPSVSPSSVLTPDENDDSPMREEVSNETGGQQVAVPQPRNRVAQRAAKLLQAIDVLRPAQKAQRRREERRLKAKHLERSNKVREVASAGNKRSRRCDMMTPAKFSRAVNNRKC
ncbi:tumor protein p53-inducible nuclear protein 2 isoform X1 [Penaeus vannamei]|uniref:tumor protein p53-inducible nuclear protein 2 isoform X1 n=2 Tax=Penaeus vannamei TaxID=6689 RepID=UPI00387F7BCF